MGRGKSNSKSISAYNDCLNENIKNRRFLTMQTDYFKPKTDKKQYKLLPLRNHSLSFYYKYLRTEKGIVMTRTPSSISGQFAKKAFYKLVENYEKTSGKKLCEMSKNELLIQVQDCAEQKNSLIRLTDSAEQFMIHRIQLEDVVKLYLYKLFYTRIFDIQIQDEQVVFLSDYINKNFDDIFHQIEKLFETIVFDGAIIAIAQRCKAEIASIKDFDKNTNSSSVESLIKDLKSYVTKTNMRTYILEVMKPDIIFTAIFYQNIYTNNKQMARTINNILTKDLVYKGKRESACRATLNYAYNQCQHYNLFAKGTQPFTRLLNIYDINKRSSLYDIHILKTNADYKPYQLDGIVSKYFIDYIIKDNSDKLSKDIKDNGLNLYSVYNNPNCIIEHIHGRDYEMINDIITSAKISFEKYYLTNLKKSCFIDASKLLEIISYFNERYVSSFMSNIVPDATISDIDHVDYDKILNFRNIRNGDGV